MLFVCIVIGWMSSIQVMECHLQSIACVILAGSCMAFSLPAATKHKSFPPKRKPLFFCQNIVTWSTGSFHYHSPFSITCNYRRKNQENVNRSLIHLSFSPYLKPHVLFKIWTLCLKLWMLHLYCFTTHKTVLKPVILCCQIFITNELSK